MTRLIFLVAMMTLLLPGCSATIEHVVVKTEHHYPGLPTAIMKDCDITPPPSKDRFIDASDEDRIKMLSTFSISLLGNINDCQGTINHIREYDMRQIELVKELNNGKPKSK